MKLLMLIVVIASVVISLVLSYARPSPATSRPPQALFIGFTNGFVGPAAAVYGALSTNHAAFIKQWFNSGTNTAVFLLINHRHWPIKVFGSVGLQTQGTLVTNHRSYMLDGLAWPEVFIPVGQAVTVQIAMIPEQNPAQMTFTYTRGEQNSHTGKFFKALRELHALLFRGGVVNTLESFESDWFGP